MLQLMMQFVATFSKSGSTREGQKHEVFFPNKNKCAHWEVQLPASTNDLTFLPTRCLHFWPLGQSVQFTMFNGRQDKECMCMAILAQLFRPQGTF